MSELLPLADGLPEFLEPYLPQIDSRIAETPFVTLTWAQSLDSRISAAPGERTVISHLETKTMTHYIRSRHDSIMVGIGTFLADNPSLSCRYRHAGDSSHLIRPIIVDPSFKSRPKLEKSAMMETHRNGGSATPVVIVSDQIDTGDADLGVIIVKIPQDGAGKLAWADVFQALAAELQIRSVMVEGGAHVINDLIVGGPTVVNSVIITIGPVFLGQKGVQVSPPEHTKLSEIKWWTGIQDSVMAARLARSA